MGESIATACDCMCVRACVRRVTKHGANHDPKRVQHESQVRLSAFCFTLSRPSAQNGSNAVEVARCQLRWPCRPLKSQTGGTEPQQVDKYPQTYVDLVRLMQNSSFPVLLPRPACQAMMSGTEYPSLEGFALLLDDVELR